MTKKLLLHTCCAPCVSYSIEKIKEMGYSPAIYFFNPNIHPMEEYEKRRDELIEFSKKKNYELIIDNSGFDDWLKKAEAYAQEPERGARCAVCFDIRLRQTAKFAKENGYPYFSTSLTISPHKSYKVISEIGNKLAEEFSISYVDVDFKKNDGFKKSLEISKEYNLFRQNYCGCKYSIRKS